MPFHRLAPLTVVVALAVFLGSSTSAMAATEIGSRCMTVSGAAATMVQTVDPVAGPGYSAPTAGVITKWGTNLPAVPSLPMRLKTVRPGTAAGTWTVVGTSEVGSGVAGINEFATRVPVSAGDRLAMYSILAAVYCAPSDPGELVAIEPSSADTAVGGTITPAGTANVKLAMFAVIEPDADADGFGDETQDLCPQSASFQTACPAVKLARLLLPGKNSLLAYVTSNVAAPVTVSGSASVPSTSKASAAKTIRLKSITKTVAPGDLAKFTLKYSSKLKSALNKLPRSKKVRLTVKITGTGVINTDSKTYRVTLRGRR